MNKKQLIRPFKVVNIYYMNELKECVDLSYIEVYIAYILETAEE